MKKIVTFIVTLCAGLALISLVQQLTSSSQTASAAVTSPTLDIADVQVKIGSSGQQATVKDYGSGKTIGFAVVTSQSESVNVVHVVHLSPTPMIVVPGHKTTAPTTQMGVSFKFSFAGNVLKVEGRSPQTLMLHVVAIYQ